MEPTKNEERLSHYLEIDDKYGRIIQVPVIDVRDGVVERMIANQMLKAGNRSKHINYNEYHMSHKPKTNI
jgi:hypothetical protein